MDFRKALWAVSIFAGLAYFISNPWHPFPGSIVLKGLSVSALAAVAWLSVPSGRNRLLLTLGLALSSLGDILLDISSGMFVFGLGAFLFAHICYIQLFFAQRRKGDALGLVRVVLAVLLFAFSITFSLWLMPGLGEMALPVMTYVGVLTGMVYASMAWKTGNNHIMIGAFLFLISDAVLGANRFKQPIPLRGWIVWGTYYAAQYLIASGSIRELVKQRR